MASVTVGKKVPDFTSTTTDGKPWRLKDTRGKKLVLFFYPKDMTSGCTIEAQDFRDRRLFVLDTNVLMHDPTRDLPLRGTRHLLPMVVLEELDANKKGVSEVGPQRCARSAASSMN
jgi:peroxiredoxin Q/BCP